MLQADGMQLVFDDLQHAGFTGQDVHEVADADEHLVVVRLDLLALESDELVEAEFQDVLHLLFGEDVLVPHHAGLATNEDAKLLGGAEGEVVGLEAFAGFVTVAAVADDLDEVVQMTERQKLSLQLFRLHLGLLEQEAGATDDDLTAVLDVARNGVLHAEHTRLAAVDGQHVDGKAGLQRRVLVEIVQHHLAACIALEVHHHTGVFVRLIAHAADLGDDLFIGQLSNALHQLRTVHVEGDLGDDDLLAVAVFHDLSLATNAHAAVAGLHVLADAVGAEDDAARREVRAFDVGLQLCAGDLRIVDLGAHGIHHLAEIVRRHVGGHAHGDAGATIDDEIWKRRRKHRRLSETFVVVRDEIDGLLLHVRHQGAAQMRHAGFRITHGCRGVAFHRAEVPLRIDQRLTNGPGLPHVNQRGINNGLTMRMVVTRGVAADLRALHVLLRRIERKLMHRIKNAALGRFQTITDIRQRTGNDDGHRVVEEGVLHFFSDRDGADIGVLHGQKAKGLGEKGVEQMSGVTRRDCAH